MSLREINKQQAILLAIEEFDEIGREAFLTKYGFGHSRTYFLLHAGKRYDSKAIVGAAHGYQFAEPLKSGEFVGGERTVADLLEGMGFEVLRTSGEAVDAGEEEASTPRYPNWSRDELILALAACRT